MGKGRFSFKIKKVGIWILVRRIYIIIVMGFNNIRELEFYVLSYSKRIVYFVVSFFYCY